MKSLVNRAKSLILFGAMTVTGAICSASTPTLAGTLHNDWVYGIDSMNDATARISVGGGTTVGGNVFEIGGMAFNISEDNVTFAINSNLGVDGAVVPYASGYSHTGWGDLFLTNTDTGKSYGINFTVNNESGVELGIYENIAVTSVGAANDGWSTYSGYANFVSSRGGNPSMGDLAINDPFLGNTTNNIMTSGSKIGDIASADLTGLDFGHFNSNGSQTFGLSFARSLLEPGNYIAHILQECANDGVAVTFEVPEIPPVEDVPESSILLGLGMVGLLFSRRFRCLKNTLN
jgi:hypothetical protein